METTEWNGPVPDTPLSPLSTLWLWHTPTSGALLWTCIKWAANS